MKQRGLNDLTRTRASAFLRSYDLAPLPPFSPLSRGLSKLPLYLSLPVCRLSSLQRERGGGGRGGAESYDHKNVWPCINHSIHSGVKYEDGGVDHGLSSINIFSLYHMQRACECKSSKKGKPEPVFVNFLRSRRIDS
jgi:hypothetical protein